MSEPEYAELNLVELFRADPSICRCIPLSPVAAQKGGVVRFGRVAHDNFADVAINSSKFSSMVSRKHASMINKNNQWSIIDHESLNGVLVNYVKIPPGKQTALHDGDTITFGTDASDLVYTFEVGRRKGYLVGQQDVRLLFENLAKVAQQGFFSEDEYKLQRKIIEQRAVPGFLVNPDLTPATTNDIPGFTESEFRAATKEHVFKFSYEFHSKKWHKAVAVITMDKTPFDKGAMRLCWKLRDWTQATGTQEFVAKQAQDSTEPQVTYFCDAEMQAFCQYCADQYNQRGPLKTVSFVDATVLQFIERPGSPVFACEPFIKGKYTKYSNNWGFVSPEDRNTPQAFSHFSYELTGGSCLICDIQGVGDMYTDPQVHSRDHRGFGKGNMGRDGFQRFFKTHKCNQICQQYEIALANRKTDDTGTGSCRPGGHIVLMPKKSSADPFTFSDTELAQIGYQKNQFNELVKQFTALSGGKTEIEKVNIVQLCQSLGVADVSVEHLVGLADSTGPEKHTVPFTLFVEWWASLFVKKGA